jgi:hypothetical protein
MQTEIPVKESNHDELLSLLKPRIMIGGLYKYPNSNNFEHRTITSRRDPGKRNVYKGEGTRSKVSSGT